MARVIKVGATEAAERRVRPLGGTRRPRVILREHPAGQRVIPPEVELGSQERAPVDGVGAADPGDAFVALGQRSGSATRLLQQPSLPPASIEPEASQMGRNEFCAEAERLRRLVQRVVERLLRERQNMLQAARPQIVDLAMAIAERIVRATARCDPGVVRRVVSEALGQVQDREHVRVRLNLQDIACLQKTGLATEAELATVEGLELVEDADIEPGGCVVETDMGAVDARIQTQLDQIEQALSRALGTGRVNGPSDEPAGVWSVL